MSAADSALSGNRGDGSSETAAPATEPMHESASAASPGLRLQHGGIDSGHEAMTADAPLLPSPTQPQSQHAHGPLPPSSFYPPAVPVAVAAAASPRGPPSPFFHPAAAAAATAYSSPLMQPHPQVHQHPGSGFYPASSGAGMIGGYASPSLLPSSAHPPPPPPHDFFVSHNNPYAHQLTQGGGGVGGLGLSAGVGVGVGFGSSPSSAPWSISLSHPAHASATPSRSLHATRHRKQRRARGPDEKTILAATRLLRCNGVDMAMQSEQQEEHDADKEEGAKAQVEEEEEQEQEQEEDDDAVRDGEASHNTPSSKPASRSSSPAGAKAARSAAAAAAPSSAAATAQAAAAAAAAVTPLPVPALSAAASSRDSSAHSSPATRSSAASDASASTAPASSALPAAALVGSESTTAGSGSEPRYPTLLDVAADPNFFDCADFVIQHGAYLPPLHVRFVADMNGTAAPPQPQPPVDADATDGDGTAVAAADGVGSSSAPVGENLTEVALRWLLEDLDADGDPVIGIDAEGRQIHLLQLSTRSRCVLIRLPKYSNDKDEGKARQTQTQAGSQTNGNATTTQTSTAPATPTLTAQPAPSTPSMQPRHNVNGANHIGVASAWQTNPPPNGLEQSPLVAPLPPPAAPAASATTTTTASGPSPDSFGPPEALYHARGVSAGATPPPFPIPPLLRSLLEDASISKSGAELWGDALDIYRDLGIMLNGGLDMTRAFTSRLSLELMTNVALVGVEAAQQGVSAFVKDRASTTSAWDADRLTLRQLVYAALDAQTSFFIGKNLARPPSFDLRRLSQPWLQQAGSWLLMSKFMEQAQEKELRTSFDDMIFTETGLSVICSQYNKRIRLGSDVTVHLTDGSKVSCLVSGVSGRRADLEWENAADMLQRDTKDIDIERITLSRKWEDTLLPRPVKQYLQSVVHSEGENHPIVAALLSFFYAGPDVADPTLLTKELAATSNLSAAAAAASSASASADSSAHPSSGLQLPAELLQQPWIRDLNDSQRDAVALALWNPLVSVQGPPGSGKCFMRGTQLMLADGRCKAVESLTAGDALMGDDGTPRRIHPASIRYRADGSRLPSGHGRLFTIASAEPTTGRIPFTVNEEHILVLRVKGRLWQPELREFLAAPPEVQRSARMIQAPALPFTGHNGGLTRALGDVLQRSISADEAAQWSWLLGVWLACGEGMALRLPCDRSGTRVHESHQPICQRLQAWRTTLLPAIFTTPAPAPAILLSNCQRPSSSFCRIPLGGRDDAFALLLRRLRMLGNRVDAPRRLPLCLLTETVPIRSALVAGLVDGCGSLGANPRTLQLRLPTGGRATCMQQVASLCRGLGFCVSLNVGVGASVPPKAESMTISGFGLHALSLALEWKRPTSSDRDDDDDSSRFFPFTVTSCGVGDYFGFEVDGNRRFLLSDCTVTHNTSTIAAIVRTLICDPTCRVLCVARTNTAARHMASACAKYIGPQKLTLQVSTEFFREWHEAQYQELLDGGYVPGMTGGFDGRYRDHQVLVMTTGICFTRPELTQGRTVVILDESSQIWDLEALLFLRSMDSCRQLVMFGDIKQLSCYVAPEWRVSANSILDLANLASTRARVFPRHWHDTGLLQVRQCMLTTQYRMVKHLGNMISDLFYDGILRSADNSSMRAVSWHDVRGFSQSDDAYSVYNLAEVNEVIRLWRHLCAHGYRPDQIVVISLYEAQRQKLAETGVISEHRIFNCDSFQGQEAPIVILVLANNVTTEFLRDSRRVNVACSRAQQRLYIVGDLSTFSSPDAGVWQHIARYATSEWRPQMALPDVVDEADFPALAASASANNANAGATNPAHASSPAGSAATAPSSGASSSAIRPAAVSSWSSSSKPPASILSAMKASPVHSPSPSPSLHRATTGLLGGGAASASQSHVAVVLRGQNGTAPSTPQSHAQHPPLHHSPVPSTLLSRLSQAAMGAPSAFPSAVTAAAASFASAAAAAHATTPASSVSSLPTASRSRSLTSRAAPFVPSRSAQEFVPGAAFRMPAPAASTSSLPLTSAPAPAPSVHAEVAARSPLLAATAPTAVPASASASASAAVHASPSGVPASALPSSLSAVPSPSTSSAAASSAAGGGGGGIGGGVVAPAPSAPSAAVLSPASVPSIHHPDSFPPVSASLLPAPALTHQPPRSAPLSFAARVAAAAAAAAASTSASANSVAPAPAAAPAAVGVFSAGLPPSSSFASCVSAASLPSAAATVFAPPTTVVATPPVFRSSGAGAWQNKSILAATRQTSTATHGPTPARAGPPVQATAPAPAAAPAPAPAPAATAAALPPSSTPSKKSKSSASSRAAESGWNCGACSFLNLTAERFCEVCETPREG